MVGKDGLGWDRACMYGQIRINWMALSLHRRHALIKISRRMEITLAFWNRRPVTWDDW